MILTILCAFLTVGGGMLAGQGACRYGEGRKDMGGNCGQCGGGALTAGG